MTLEPEVNKRLIRAAQEGSLHRVEALVANGADVNAREEDDGFSALMWAAQKGHHDVFIWLLEHGADLNYSDRVGWDPLTLLCDTEFIEQVVSLPVLSVTKETGVRLLYRHHGQAWVRELLVRRGVDLSEWRDSFRQLHERIVSYHGDSLFHGVLAPVIPWARDRLETMRYVREMSSSLTDDDWLDLYAFSRVNDVLLHAFQPQRKQQLMNQRHLSLDEYARFFSSLGFEISRPLGFSPFFHEIVYVDQLESGPPVVKDLLWPVVMFGDLLFSRAGVRIESGPECIDKNLAENSKLYFTYWRLNREAEDMSAGWGHNSQWGFRFHPRCYATSQAFHYNIDGNEDVNQPPNPNSSQQGLSREQRIELLTNRCWVLRKPEGDDQWYPYRDRYTEPR